MRVVQAWMSERCTLKQQAVVLSALRGCDGVSKEDLSKRFTRQLRQTFLIPADPAYLSSQNDNFMKSTITSDHVDALLTRLDHYPLHWVLHFAHAAEIVGYKHPVDEIRNWWCGLYFGIVTALHLNPETEEQCDLRLRDVYVRE